MTESYSILQLHFVSQSAFDPLTHTRAHTILGGLYWDGEHRRDRDERERRVEGYKSESVTP